MNFQLEPEIIICLLCHLIDKNRAYSAKITVDNWGHKMSKVGVWYKNEKFNETLNSTPEHLESAEAHLSIICRAHFAATFRDVRNGERFCARSSHQVQAEATNTSRHFDAHLNRRKVTSCAATSFGRVPTHTLHTAHAAVITDQQFGIYLFCPLARSLIGCALLINILASLLIRSRGYTCFVVYVADQIKLGATTAPKSQQNRQKHRDKHAHRHKAMLTQI